MFLVVMRKKREIEKKGEEEKEEAEFENDDSKEPDRNDNGESLGKESLGKEEEEEEEDQRVGKRRILNSPPRPTSKTTPCSSTSLTNTDDIIDDTNAVSATKLIMKVKASGKRS
ncbi:hypothetical protein ADUPG1_010624 [Aduncisulcus paluster]|uniref:Uncharacterized protein n=1 Tax=Aduncisulcus paluster TaxID=2918883 RepID=A0ABQ5JV22_9EUKA|nr:hypothetical protein ADUPG1_010624 [Aduncisulcus paluster]